MLWQVHQLLHKRQNLWDAIINVLTNVQELVSADVRIRVSGDAKTIVRGRAKVVVNNLAETLV